MESKRARARSEDGAALPARSPVDAKWRLLTLTCKGCGWRSLSLPIVGSPRLTPVGAERRLPPLIGGGVSGVSCYGHLCWNARCCPLLDDCAALPSPPHLLPPPLSLFRPPPPPSEDTNCRSFDPPSMFVFAWRRAVDRSTVGRATRFFIWTKVGRVYRTDLLKALQGWPLGLSCGFEGFCA